MWQRQRLLSAALALTCVSGIARASVDHYGVDQGLSQNSVVAIETDARGFLWLGTEDGLNRFDGHSFKVLRSEPGEPGLSDSFIQRLARVGEVLWVGTIGGGLSRVRLLEERAESLADALPDAAPSRLSIHALLPLTEERALIGTQEGLSEVRWPLGDAPASSTVLTEPVGLSGGLVRALAALPDGRIAVAGAQDLCLLDTALRQCDPLHIDLLEGQLPPALSVASDTRGRLWVSFERLGLARIELESGRSQWWRFGTKGLPAQMSRIMTLEPVADADLWIGSDIGTYRYLDSCACFGARVDASSDADPNARKIVYGLKADGENSVWIGAWNHGLDRYDPARQAIERWRPRLGSGGGATMVHNVRALVPDGERVWLGTYGTGVVEATLHSAGDASYRQPESLIPTSLGASLIWALASNGANGLWIGSDNGLAHWQPGQSPLRIELGPDAEDSRNALRAVRALLQDREGRLWIGGEGGLYCLPPGDPAINASLRARKLEGLPDSRIFALHQDRGGQHWIGTWRGVYALDAANWQVEKTLAPDAKLRVTWDIADANDGGLWIGTNDGLVHVALDGAWRRYTERDGLANRVIYGIEQDRDGRLWLSSNRGITRFDPDSGSAVNFGLNDQLQQSEFLFGAHAQDEHGRLLFGGPNGFNRIDASRVALADAAPVAVLTGIRIDGTDLDTLRGRIDVAAPVLTELALQPSDSVVELHYGAIAHDQPRDLRFRYRLKGYDRDWQDAGERRFASYTNIPPGHYVFEVDAISRFGSHSQVIRTLQVESIPWWWETVWSRAALLGLFGLGIAVIVRWRLAELSHQRQVLRVQVAERTQEIAQQRDQLARVNSELAALSERDPLTGLPNRRALLTKLADYIGAAPPRHTHICLVLFDLDRFKSINDSRGHGVGDQVLVHLARLWETQLPPEALLGRYGGEEFMLLLPDQTPDEAAQLVAELLQSLRSNAVPAVEPALHVTASCGLAQWSGRESLEQLVHRADTALYRAKNSGRDRYELA